jgi:flagellar biosynthesis/type III secretory pathway M-ring protein FliF/YscJ
LGPGKTVVRTNVQINSQETQMTKEAFDPDNKVVRSQRQSVDDAGTKAGGTPGVQANIPGGEATKAAGEIGSKRTSEVVTYEIGHTTSRISEPRGQVQKLSVAVLVDGKYEKDKYIPRTKEEMEVIKGMVKRAVGFDEDRGDEIEVANVAFKIQPAPALQAPGTPELKDMIISPLGIGAGIGVLLALGALGFSFRGVNRAREVQTPATMITWPSATGGGYKEWRWRQKIVRRRSQTACADCPRLYDATVPDYPNWLQRR